VGILPDFMIQEEIGIEPYAPCMRRDGVVSFGQTSYGYDARLGRKFKVFTNVFGAVVDPKHFDPKAFVDVESDCCLIPPNSFALGESLEYFRIPRDVLAVCLGKSTYARCGIVVNITPLEPEWEGKITIEISNTTPLPARVYANEGIAQILFLRAEKPCRVS
jgi:dCTP deaminase